MATDDKTDQKKPTTPAPAAAKTVPVPAAEQQYQETGIDPRLDNRTGDARPPLEEHPAKPQQIDGPDVMHQAEHTRRVLADRDGNDTTARKGMFSPGPHGLSDEAQRETDQPFIDGEVTGAKPVSPKGN